MTATQSVGRGKRSRDGCRYGSMNKPMQKARYMFSHTVTHPMADKMMSVKLFCSRENEGYMVVSVTLFVNRAVWAVQDCGCFCMGISRSATLCHCHIYDDNISVPHGGIFECRSDLD